MSRENSLQRLSEDRTQESRTREVSMSSVPFPSKVDTDGQQRIGSSSRSDAIQEGASAKEVDDLMDSEGYADRGSSEKIVKPLTPEALAAFNEAQARSGVIYISRIPPGMQPAKVRHLLSQHGEVGRVYLQQEDAKTAYLRRKHTSTKKPHFVEGWVEFKDKRVARSVAGMLNAQPIGGKKGTRWRDDVWTMKYLPKFKWNMLTEQIAHEAAVHAAKLRVELAQSRSEQREYLRNVELGRIVDKRNEKRKEKGQRPIELKRPVDKEGRRQTKRARTVDSTTEHASIF
ncbi:hypothetical protein JVT61DRAFT_3856 [Boletus reticuloceps]|uniref:18S rRNA factor 2 n=1 Tax=Boletus reticuloceps TaxID=495285 RepID=A0A8I2YNN3_9AGAM|nr:hypothetical protein JVT61DRAFT_3856 [Boletus reticuloceps]